MGERISNSFHTMTLQIVMLSVIFCLRYVYLIHAAHKMVMHPIPFLAVIPQRTR